MAEGLVQWLSDPATLIGLGTVAALAAYYLFTRPRPPKSRIPLDRQSVELPVTALFSLGTVWDSWVGVERSTYTTQTAAQDHECQRCESCSSRAREVVHLSLISCQTEVGL